MEDKKDLFYIFSINLIAYLKSKGFFEYEITKSHTGKLAFWFKDSNELQETIQAYKRDYELQDFLAELRRVKREMRNYYK